MLENIFPILMCIFLFIGMTAGLWALHSISKIEDRLNSICGKKRWNGKGMTLEWWVKATDENEDDLIRKQGLLLDHLKLEIKTIPSQKEQTKLVKKKGKK